MFWRCFWLAPLDSPYTNAHWCLKKKKRAASATWNNLDHTDGRGWEWNSISNTLNVCSLARLPPLAASLRTDHPLGEDAMTISFISKVPYPTKVLWPPKLINQKSLIMFLLECRRAAMAIYCLLDHHWSEQERNFLAAMYQIVQNID